MGKQVCVAHDICCMTFSTNKMTALELCRIVIGSRARLIDGTLPNTSGSLSLDPYLIIIIVLVILFPSFMLPMPPSPFLLSGSIESSQYRGMLPWAKIMLLPLPSGDRRMMG